MEVQKSTAADRLVMHQDALTLLGADHAIVLELFEEFQSALEEGADTVGELAEQICRELEMHSEIEEDIFYPALAGAEALRPLVEEAMLAHGELRASIQHARSLHADDPEFGSTMLEMIEQAERHINEEENMIFPEVVRHLEEQLTDLGGRMDERKRELTAAFGGR
ncbi:MAG: hemerythrin domain-containing protein [Pseudomonadota bacterium]